MVIGEEIQPIIQHIFGDVNNYLVSEQIQVNCPRCQERDGLSRPDGKFNLEINTEKRKFRCWRCDDPTFSGSLGRLIKICGTNHDYEIYKSYASLFHDYGNNEDEKIFEDVVLPTEMILFANMNMTNPEHLEAYMYMVIERQIPKETLIERRIGFCTTGRFRKRIIIPSYDQYGELNYFVGRLYDKTIKKSPYMNPKVDKSKIIFNEGLVDWNATVYIVEGGFDDLSLVNSVPMLGKTLSIALFNKIKELKPNIVIVLDPDAYSKSVELFHILHDIYVECEEKIKIVKLPQTKDNDDIDEIRKKYGQKVVLENLYGARNLTTEDLFLRKLVKNSDYDYRNKNGGFNSNSKSVGWK